MGISGGDFGHSLLNHVNMLNDTLVEMNEEQKNGNNQNSILSSNNSKQTTNMCASNADTKGIMQRLRINDPNNKIDSKRVEITKVNGVSKITLKK